MNKLFFIAITIFLATAATSQPKTTQNGLEVRPATIEFSITPGTTASRKIFVTNTLTEKTQFTVYLNDWRRDTVGGHVFSEPGPDQRSCAKWVTIDNTFFELEPGQRQEINITLQHPIDSTEVLQMKWCMLFIETTKEKKVESATGFKTTIANRYRVGVHLYQTPPEITEKEVKLIQITSLAADANLYRLICRNTGKTQLQCSGYIELFSLSDGSKLRLPSQEFPIFPEQIRYVDFSLPEQLAKGKYTLTGIIDAGIDVPLEAGQLTIEIK
jgi:hypothetical protein